MLTAERLEVRSRVGALEDVNARLRAELMEQREMHQRETGWYKVRAARASSERARGRGALARVTGDGIDTPAAAQPRVLELERKTSQSLSLLEELRLNVELLNVMYEGMGKEIAKCGRRGGGGCDCGYVVVVHLQLLADARAGGGGSGGWGLPCAHARTHATGRRCTGATMLFQKRLVSGTPSMTRSRGRCASRRRGAGPRRSRTRYGHPWVFCARGTHPRARC